MKKILSLYRRLPAPVQRANRSFAQAFIGGMAAKWVAGPILVSLIDDTFRIHADAVAGAAFMTWLTALGWNATKPIAPEAKP